jgi:hypothetical protein
LHAEDSALIAAAKARAPDSAQSTPINLTEDQITEAIMNYSLEYQVPFTNVTYNDVAASKEGFAYFCMLNTDTGSRSAIGQKFARALAKDPLTCHPCEFPHNVITCIDSDACGANLEVDSQGWCIPTL